MNITWLTALWACLVGGRSGYQLTALWACLAGEHARTRDQQCIHTSMLSKSQLEKAQKAIELLSSLPNTESVTASKPEAAIKTEKLRKYC